LNHGVKITAVGHYAPPDIVTNEDYAARWGLDTNEDWISSRTGMKRRHWATAEQATSDLAIEAARITLAKAGLRGSDIDCYVLTTVTPDYRFPATACIVAAQLGAADKPAFDIEAACSGFIYGLAVASSLVRSGVYHRVLLISAETLSKITNLKDRSSAVLFGDGAAAVLLESSANDSLLSAELGSDGSRPEILRIYAGGSRRALTPEGIEAGEQYMYMEGREVFKLAVTKMIEATDTALRKANLTKADVAFLIPHQANKRIIDATAKYLEMPPDKVIVNIEEYGNTSSASIPIALSEALDEGRIKSGDVLVFVSFGGGLSWAALVWRWA
jgi:3-oxoacyl-[acyl-carrier-protein] synthase-3